MQVQGRESLLPLLDEGKPTQAEWLPRRIVMVLLALAVLALPKISFFQPGWIAKGAIYVIVGLSLNILIGYAGQVSLGHQAFVGIGSFTSALLVDRAELPFYLGVVASVFMGAFTALLLGIVALRLKGLYLALITLAYGLLSEHVLFSFPLLAGGVGAPRPPGFEGDAAYAYLCMIFVALVLLLDWRLMKSKAGRAILAIRENEIAAASFGINVVRYKLMAFMLSGAFAGIAGALLGHLSQQVSAATFDFTLAMTFVLMTVVGGLGSRAGIFIGAMFFAIFPLKFNQFVDAVLIASPVLLLMTLTMFPGGLGQQFRPIIDWVSGKPFSMKKHDAGIQSGGGGVRP